MSKQNCIYLHAWICRENVASNDSDPSIFFPATAHPEHQASTSPLRLARNRRLSSSTDPRNFPLPWSLSSKLLSRPYCTTHACAVDPTLLPIANELASQQAIATRQILNAANRALSYCAAFSIQQQSNRLSRMRHGAPRFRRSRVLAPGNCRTGNSNSSFNILQCLSAI